MGQEFRTPIRRYREHFAVVVTVEFLVALVVYFFAARNAAHRFRVASAIAFRPAALIVRFFFLTGATASAVTDSPLIPAHLSFCARAIFLREAAENFRFLETPSTVVAADVPGVLLPFKNCRTSAI